MQRVTAPGNTAALPTPKPDVNPPGFWSSGNPASGVLATVLDEDWFNDVQENLCQAIEGAGIVLVKGDGSQLLQAIRALIPFAGYYGQFRNFYEQTPPPGWAVRNGALLSNVSANYPALLSELQKPANAWKLKTLAQWNALSTTAGGIGGVPFFVVDASADTIKLPDTRNDYERATGTLLSNVGDWHSDAVQTGISRLDAIGAGNVGEFSAATPTGDVTKSSTTASSYLQLTATTSSGWRFTINQRFANETRTRAFGVLPCVYVGGN